jgi:uncharacterized DUF497 family protein
VRFTFDPRKNANNLEKHGLSLADAPLVYEAPDKLTLESPREGENLSLDIALVERAGVVLVLVDVLREPDEVRAISLRRASRKERALYVEWQEDS